MVTTVSFRDGGLFIFVKEMINIAIKLATSITYIADGSQTNFSVPFDYLRPSFVHVAVDDAEVSEGFTISNRMVMFDSAPAKDAAVHIYRSTPTTRLVSWADASILKAIDMTIAEMQQLHILEETNDWTKTNSIVLNDEGNAWQGRNYRISNVNDPVDAQDVATKHYIDNEEDSFSTTMTALKNQAEYQANIASTNAKQAKDFATNAKTYMENAQGYMDNAKEYSENVNVFVPVVSSSGVLSWSNKAGLENPASVNIKGAKGDKGDTGATGATGAKGDKGDKGDTGVAGAAATIRIGTVATGEPGTNASVSNSGTSAAAILNFVIPRGNPGEGGGGSASVTVDTELSATSLNPVQNKVIKEALDNKLDLYGTALYAKKDNRGYDIYDRYAAKVDVESALANKLGKTETAAAAIRDEDNNRISTTYIKTINGNIPDINGNIDIDISGGSGGGGTNITVDTELSSTSTNPVQNKVIKAALDNKLNKTDNAPTASVAEKAFQDGDGNTISSTYVKTVNGIAPDTNGNVAITASGGGGTNITVDSTLSSTSTNPVQNKVIKEALDNKLDIAGTAAKATADGEGNAITTTYAKKADISGMVKSVNGTAPDTNGNVTLTISGASTSAENTWTETQEFYNAKTFRHVYKGYFVEGTTDTPVTSTMWYKATGAFTLDFSTLALLLTTYESVVFSAYFTATADYALTIEGAGTMTYVGNASDVAISSSGTLLTVWLIKNPDGNIVSIIQAHKLGSGT